MSSLIPTADATTPEEEELRAQQARLAQLQDELADAEAELESLHVELGAFDRRYKRLVGRRYAMLDQLLLQLAERRAECTPDDPVATDELRVARDRANATAPALAVPDREAPTQERSGTLKPLFRTAARLFHPDLADDDADRGRRTQFMSAANRCYQEADEIGLQQLIEQWRQAPEAVVGEDVGSRWVRTIRQLAQVRRRLAAVREDLSRLRTSVVARLHRQVEDARASGVDLLQRIVDDLDDHLAALRRTLDRQNAW